MCVCVYIYIYTYIYMSKTRRVARDLVHEQIVG